MTVRGTAIPLSGQPAVANRDVDEGAEHEDEVKGGKLKTAMAMMLVLTTAIVAWADNTTSPPSP